MRLPFTKYSRGSVSGSILTSVASLGVTLALAFAPLSAKADDSQDLDVFSMSTYEASDAGKETLTTTVIDVIKPERPGDSWIYLLAAGGRALRVSDEDRARLKILDDAVGKPKFLKIEATNLGDIDRVDSVVELPGAQAYGSEGDFPIEPLSPAPEGIVKQLDFHFEGYDLTPEGIYSFFKNMKLRRNSQCFHRAYYWGHQLYRNTGVYSHKVFMFFSWKYIRTFNYYWWFHVAPYVYNDKGEEVVLDPTFLSKPVGMQAWTNNFLRNDPVCPTVEKYEGHSKHGRNDWCFLVKTPMHYYHPNMVEKANKEGVRVTKWDPGYLKIARASRGKKLEDSRPPGEGGR